MTWQEGVAFVVILAGLGAGGFLVAQRPAFWIEFGARLGRAILPRLLAVLLKRMPPEDEAEWGKLSVVFATAKGNVRRNSMDSFANVPSNGKFAMRFDEDSNDRLIGVALLESSDDVLLATRAGKAIRFAADEVREFTIRGIDLIAKFAYLKNGAMYSIGVLGMIMLLEVFGVHIPFWLAPLVTVSLLSGFLWLSVKADKKAKAELRG